MNLPEGWIVEDSIIINTRPDEDLGVYDDSWVTNHASDTEIDLKCRNLVRYVDQIPDASTVLDIGCASGKLVHLLQKKGYFATGIDEPAQSIEYARANFLGTFVQDYFISPKSQMLNFDVVILSHVLEHFQDPIHTLERAKDYLRPGGHLIIAVPNLSAYETDSIWRSISAYSAFAPEHKIAFTPATLQRYVEQAGFQVVRIGTHTYRHQIVAGVVRNIGRRVLNRRTVTKTGSATSGRLGRLESLSQRIFYLVPGFLTHIPTRLSERNQRGTELIVVARLGRNKDTS